MGILDVLKKKKPEPDEDFPKSEPRRDFPEDFEQFKLPPPKIEEKPSPFERAEKITEKAEEPFVPSDILSKTTSEVKHEKNSDKLELILSKLETIDARLRLIEEKLK